MKPELPGDPRLPAGLRQSDIDANDEGEMETLTCIGCGQTFQTNDGNEVCPRCERKEDSRKDL